MMETGMAIETMSKHLFTVVAEYFEAIGGAAGGKQSTSWDNEGFYQWVCFRGLALELDKAVIADRDFNGKNVDLQILENGKCAMALEMKRPCSSNGENEIPSFVADVRSLLRPTDVTEKTFIITTIHEKTTRDGNVKSPSSKSQVPEIKFVTRSKELDDSIIFEIVGVEIESDFGCSWGQM